MNLLLLDQFSDLGGAQLCLVDLLPAIRTRGWKAVVAAPGEGALFERARTAGAVVERISCGPYSSGRKSGGDVIRFARDFPRLAREIRDLIARYRIDLVYVNGPRIVPAAVRATRRQLPMVFHCHSSVPKSYADLLVGRPLASVNATVVSSSRFTAESIARHIDPANLHVVYNGVADCAREKVPNTSGCRIGVIGRIAPQKGQALFVRAARILLDAAPACQFEISGSPLFSDPEAMHHEQEVRHLAAGLPVKFTGWTDDVASVLARLDVLVVPSTAAEATTRVILEAFSAGVPVVAFAVGGISEVVSHGRTGFLVDQATPQALAIALQNVLSLERGKLDEVVNVARREWEARFTVERYREEVMNLLEHARS